MVDFFFCNSVSCTVIFSSTLLTTLSCCHVYRKNTCLLFSNTQFPNFSDEYFLIQTNCMTKQSVGQYSKQKKEKEKQHPIETLIYLVPVIHGTIYVFIFFLYSQLATAYIATSGSSRRECALTFCTVERELLPNKQEWRKENLTCTIQDGVKDSLQENSALEIC